LGAIFIGYITVGGFNMQLYDFVPEIINIITATIIYSAACALIFKGLYRKIFKKRSADTDLDGKPITNLAEPLEPPDTSSDLPPEMKTDTTPDAKTEKGGER